MIIYPRRPTLRSLHVRTGCWKTFSSAGKKHGPETPQYTESDISDHSWRQMNHIWTSDEIFERRKTSLSKFVPRTASDWLMKGVMQTMYYSFNFVTGYKHEDPSPRSIEWRLIILESFAGVPGFVGAGFRHFYSLRNLKRDHGMIYTLLEEAENERMHLLVCLKMFDASMLVRGLVIGAQFSMTPFLLLTYMLHPPALHRFVGYLEETAVGTYENIVKHVETEGTQLHAEWAHLHAPDIAIGYWQLPEGERMWVDTLKRMLADEAHHRDVNHTLASLASGADNPFIHEHMEDFDKAAIRRAETLLKGALNERSRS